MLSVALLLATAQPAAWHFDVRADPVVFALLGYSVGVDAAPADSHWRAGLAAFHVDIPQLLVPFIAQPGRGVTLTEDCVSAGAFYDVEDEHRGLFFGPELLVYHLAYTVDGAPAEAREAYAHVTVGYTWFPLKDIAVLDHLFLQPWATLGVPVFHSGGVDVGNRHIADRAVNVHATVEIGARFP